MGLSPPAFEIAAIRVRITLMFRLSHNNHYSVVLLGMVKMTIMQNVNRNIKKKENIFTKSVNQAK